MDNEPDTSVHSAADGSHGSEPRRHRKEPVLYDDTVPIMSPDKAWPILSDADEKKDIVAIKEAIAIYTRSMPDLTLVNMEMEFREASMNTHLIAKEHNLTDSMTIINLQGKIDCKFVVTVQFSAKPPRPKFAAGWPSNAEENLARLADAGYLRDLEERKPSAPREKPVLTCGNCGEAGHYLRDCPEPRGRKDRDPPVDENGEPLPPREPLKCHNCQEEGHKASDCPNERVMVCRNCDEAGHASRECPKPRDYSRVQCRNCQQFGHTQVRCKEPVKPTEDEGTGFEQSGSVEVGADVDDHAYNHGEDNSNGHSEHGDDADHESDGPAQEVADDDGTMW